MFAKLRSELEEATFLVAKETGQKEIHSKLVNCLVILSQIEGEEIAKCRTPEEVEVSEVNKVSRKLKLWANRQNQCNSKILNAFLELRREGKSKITEADLGNKIGPNSWLSSNFAQMKSISDQNHGKVFHQTGEVIGIWEPVTQAINEYEASVFTNA